MHGANRSFRYPLGEAGKHQARQAASALRLASPVFRMRNLLRPPRPDEQFAAGGLVAAALNNDPSGLRRLMRKLSARLGREHWTTPIHAGLDAADNPHIHAGYTYLLQLIAHDMVHSSISLAGSTTGAMGLANTRLFPLSLETIYGGGPDVCPHPYEYDRRHRDHMGVVPRTRFRMGRLRKPTGQTSGCPYRDIARAIPADVQDGGLDPSEQLDLGIAGGTPWRTEALLADARNDDHALISQLAGLMQTLHNQIIDAIPVTGALAAMPPAEQAYRRFICTRFVVTLIYRNILLNDVLPLILHPDIHQLYTSGQPPHLDSHFPGAQDAMPVEFISGAFRFGHAMVRDEYRVNRDEPLSTGFALRQSSHRAPNDLPVSTDWLIDWSRFFKIAEREPNYSHRIGPVYAGPLLDSALFPALTAMDCEGLADRDLVTASYAHHWSVPALCREIRNAGLAGVLPDYAVWAPALRAWLAKPPAMFDPDPFTTADIDNLTADPPLTLFILFEAGQMISKSAAATDVAAGESLHLGALGSIIVAETILGALKRTPIAFEDAGPRLKDRIAAASLALLADPAILAGIPEITSMSDLLQFMIAGGAIPAPLPDQL